MFSPRRNPKPLQDCSESTKNVDFELLCASGIIFGKISPLEAAFPSSVFCGFAPSYDSHRLASSLLPLSTRKPLTFGH